MHVHANYNQTLATLGAGREDAQEIATRRAAEVRRRLAAASDKLLREEDEDVAYIKVSEAIPSNSEGNAYSTSSGSQQHPDSDPGDEHEHGSHFSAHA